MSVCASAQFMSAPVYADLDDSETMAAMRRHVNYLSSPSLEGRAMGSEGEKDAAAYLYDVFREYGLDTFYPRQGDTFGIRHEESDTLVSRNAAAYIQGYDRNLKDHYIIIGARMDNLGKRTMEVNGEQVERIYRGANGNASGMALMLELARMMKTNEILLRRSVIFVGFGASRQTFAGAWYFLNRSFPEVDKIDAMINLDALGEGERGFFAFASANDDMENLIHLVNSRLNPVSPELTRAEPLTSDHQAFYAKQIPSVMFTTGPFPERGTERDVPSIINYDMMERELEYIYNFAIELCVTQDAPLFDASARKAVVHDVKTIPYYECERRPSFLGSTDPKDFLAKWVYQYLRYPKDAVRDGIQGKVVVDFVISDKGKVMDVKVAKGVHPLLDEEAVRVISASPDWTAGRVKGKKVNASMSLTVEFRLEKK